MRQIIEDIFHNKWKESACIIMICNTLGIGKKSPASSVQGRINVSNFLNKSSYINLSTSSPIAWVPKILSAGVVASAISLVR